MSTETNNQAKLRRLKSRIETLKTTVQQAQEAYKQNPTKELKLAMCMANLDLANAKADYWLLDDKLKHEDEPGVQPGE